MQYLDRTLLRFLLPGLLARASKETIYRSGLEAMKTNCFSTTVRVGQSFHAVLLSMVGNSVSGLKDDGQRFTIPITLNLDDIDPASIEVTHFYGLDEIHFSSLRKLAIARLTGWRYLGIFSRRLFNSIAQPLFNRRTLVVRRRLDILRDIMEATLGGAPKVDALRLMNQQYGHFWAEHPGWKDHERLLDKHLEFLVDSGELVKCGGSGEPNTSGNYFRPTGKALVTLTESETEDRRHNSNIRVQWLLAFLAVGAVAMAAVQAGLVKLPTFLDLTGNATQTGCVAPPTLTAASPPIERLPGVPSKPASGLTTSADSKTKAVLGTN